MTLALAFPQEPKDWLISASVGNSVGIGTFVTGYSQTPSWTTSFVLNPTYKLPSFWGLPRINLSAYQLMSVWWLDSYVTTMANRENRVLFFDTILSATMPKILESSSTGLFLSAGLGLSLPISSFSRNMHRIIGINPSLPMGWSKWGFSAGFTPSILIWTHSQNNISAPCMNMPSTMVNPYNANTDIDQVLQGLSIYKSGEELGDGTCVVSGRQNISTLSNMFSLGWSNPNHSVSLSLTWYLNFLRSLSDKPELRSQFSSSNNFNEVTAGRVSYSYTLPIETNVVISAGVLSWQAAYDQSGRLAFPFFDFVTPGNNQTQVFLQATVGI